jgi:hypothetical protein
MTCINTAGGTTCYPPYDVMRPGSMGLSEDIMCGTSTIMLWALGIGIGWLVAEKAVSYLR